MKLYELEYMINNGIVESSGQKIESLDDIDGVRYFNIKVKSDMRTPPIFNSAEDIYQSITHIWNTSLTHLLYEQKLIRLLATGIPIYSGSFQGYHTRYRGSRGEYPVVLVWSNSCRCLLWVNESFATSGHDLHEKASDPPNIFMSFKLFFRATAGSYFGYKYYVRQKAI